MSIAIRRAAAVGAGLSGLLHLVLLSQGHHLGWALAMAGMAIVCLPCAGHLWRVASLRSWSLIAAMNASMLGVHLWLLTRADQVDVDAPRPRALDDETIVAGHAHGNAGGAVSGMTTDVGAAGLLGSHAEVLHDVLLPVASGLAAIEILLALVGLALLRRGRTVPQGCTRREQRRTVGRSRHRLCNPCRFHRPDHAERRSNCTIDG